MTLSPEKTRITRIENGFDFLGQNPRKYKGKLLIKPSRDKIKTFLVKVRKTIRKFTAMKTGDMIRTLNPMIRGWGNYHWHIVASGTFKKVDDHIYRFLWDWAKSRHQDKGKQWLARKYWHSDPKAWVFAAVEKTPEVKRRVELIRAAHIHIKRHVKVKSEVNPFGPKDDKYFARRRANQRRNYIGRTATKAA